MYNECAGKKKLAISSEQNLIGDSIHVENIKLHSYTYQLILLAFALLTCLSRKQ